MKRAGGALALLAVAVGLAALAACSKRRPTLRHPRCALVMPPQVMEDLTPGWRLAAPRTDDIPGVCTLESEDGSPRAMVLLACSPELTESRFESDQSMLGLLNGDAPVPVPGLGRAARRGEHDLMVLDDDTSCVIALTTIGAEVEPLQGFVEEVVLRLNRRTAR